MTVDLRTRSDARPAPVVEPEVFFDHDLPAALATGGPVRHLQERALRPLCVEVGDRRWTLHAVGPTIGVRSGDHAADTAGRALLRLTPRQLHDLATDQVTPIALMTAGALDLDGRLGQLMDWWLVWRTALDDVPAPWQADADLPVDLHRSFTLDDDPETIQAFLEGAGYLHLRGVFTAAEMAEVARDMDAAAPRYAPGDGRSWWAETSEGDRLVRMQGFEQHSPAAARLLDDERFVGLGHLTGDGHLHQGMPGNRLEALFKPLGVTRGISDVPWHKDCSLGRHSYDCCSLTAGVSVTGAGPTTGQLRVVAGSHRRLIWPSLLDVDRLGLPDVALPTETGDVTVHLSCTLHMAQPPTERERRVLYTSFRLPQQDEAAAAAARRTLLAARESAPVTTSQSDAR